MLKEEDSCATVSFQFVSDEELVLSRLKNENERLKTDILFLKGMLVLVILLGLWVNCVL